MTTDEKYMKEAIRQAKKAKALDEVPIGCVIVYEDKIIARGYNRRPIKIHFPMQNSMRSGKQAKNLVTGDWKDVRCTLR